MRPMTSKELAFLMNMIKTQTSFYISPDKLGVMQVEDADDGGMGGVIFLSGNEDRTLGTDIARLEFNDQDGVKVIATLSLDNFGDLFELDIWKTDFSKLISLPEKTHSP